MYAGQHRPVRYSPHQGQGVFEEQRRFHPHGSYSPSGWDHGGHFHGGYANNGYPQGAYGQNYNGERVLYNSSPEYGFNRRDDSQWRGQDAMSVRREQQEARYNELMNNSPVPSNQTPRRTPVSRTPVSHLDGSSTIASYDDDHWEETTYTVSEEEPVANVNCTNLLFGNGKKNSSLINCNRVDPKTTEVELNINMDKMEHFEQGVDRYMDRVTPSESKVNSAMQAFHCKADPVYSSQFAQYARYDYDEPAMPVMQVQQPYHQTSQMSLINQMRRNMPSEVYQSALFSEGSCSSDEDEEEGVEAVPDYLKTAPREIIVQDDHDAVSVLSDRHLVNVRLGQSPGGASFHQFKNLGGARGAMFNQVSPFNKASPLSPSSNTKGFRGSPSENQSIQDNLDENGLKKDSESSSLIAVNPADSTGENENRSEAEKTETITKHVEDEHPSFDEPDEKSETRKTRLRKKAEILTDDDEYERIPLRSPGRRMLMSNRDELLGKQEVSRENMFMEKTKESSVDKLMDKYHVEEELIGKSGKPVQEKLMGSSLLIKSQAVLAETEVLLKSYDSPSSYVINGIAGDENSEESSILDVLADDRSVVSDAYSYMSFLGSDKDKAEDMPSSRAAAALIEDMMGTLTKQPLTRIAEDSDEPVSLDLAEPRRVKGASKDLYRFL